MTTAQPASPPCPWAAATDQLGDGAALRAILDLAGPETGARILVQMETDLATTMTALQATLSPPDFRTIRAQSHVLISIVGTIGAMEMHAVAVRLNEAAHAEDLATCTTLTAQLAADADRLRAAIRRIGAAR